MWTPPDAYSTVTSPWLVDVPFLGERRPSSAAVWRRSARAHQKLTPPRRFPPERFQFVLR